METKYDFEQQIDQSVCFFETILLNLKVRINSRVSILHEIDRIDNVAAMVLTILGTKTKQTHAIENTVITTDLASSFYNHYFNPSYTTYIS